LFGKICRDGFAVSVWSALEDVPESDDEETSRSDDANRLGLDDRVGGPFIPG
jgi:hypothetical protein